MALTKPQVKEILSAAGVSSENMDTAVSKIMDGHIASIDALREQVQTYKADAEKLPEVQKELDGLKAKGDPDWQQKYEQEHTDFENFKKQVDEDKQDRSKRDLYRAVLKDAGIDEKRFDTIIRATDFSKIEMDGDKLKDTNGLKEAAKTEWADFVVSKRTDSSNPDNPPAGGGKVMSRDEIYKRDDKGRFLMDAPARQKALAELIASEED